MTKSNQWHELQAQSIVQSICKTLASETDISKDARQELEEALSCALKLLADCIEKRLGGIRWSEALVRFFTQSPETYPFLLALMNEPDFNAETFYRFWDKD